MRVHTAGKLNGGGGISRTTIRGIVHIYRKKEQPKEDQIGQADRLQHSAGGIKSEYRGQQNHQCGQATSIYIGDYYIVEALLSFNGECRDGLASILSGHCSSCQHNITLETSKKVKGPRGISEVIKSYFLHSFMQNNHLFLILCQVGMQSCCGMEADMHWRRSQQTGGDNEYCWSASDDKEELH